MRDRMTIVVGFDGSANARTAVAAAAEIVATGGTIHVVTAYRLPSVNDVEQMWRQLPEEFQASFDPLASSESLRDEAVAMLERHGVEAVGHLVEGDPATAILDVADEVDADLVVVGSRGLGRATRFLRGSVSSKVVSHVARSVLVVHDD